MLGGALWILVIGPAAQASPTMTQGEGAALVLASAPLSARADLEPPPDPDPLDVRRSPLGVVKWVALGVALAALAGGVTLMALDEANVSCGLPDDVLCPERYATMTPGAIFTAAGVSVAVAAGLLFYMDHGRNNPARASVVTPWISRGGGGLAAVLSF